MRQGLMAIGLAAALWSVPATAQQKPDAGRMVDISRPELVAKLLQEAGYKADIKKHESGDAFIESAANGSSFTVEFYGCSPDKGCTSLQFFSWYKKQPWYNIDMANRWNAKMRFLRVAIDKDGDLSTWMDVTAVGQVSYAYFADTIDWWSSMSGDLFDFLDNEEKAFGAKPKS